jgi:hypothetical protein
VSCSVPQGDQISEEACKAVVLVSGSLPVQPIERRIVAVGVVVATLYREVLVQLDLAKLYTAHPHIQSSAPLHPPSPPTHAHTPALNTHILSQTPAT